MRRDEKTRERTAGEERQRTTAEKKIRANRKRESERGTGETTARKNSRKPITAEEAAHKMDRGIIDAAR